MSLTQIVLASQSPRRKQLLKQIGIDPICCPVDIDETVQKGEEPSNYCSRLALQKAKEGWLRSDKTMPVLGSDTIVVYENEILGKPKDEEDAYTMLMKLSGHQHHVITAVAMINKKKSNIYESISKVEFALLESNDVITYIKSKEPMDKAGSYGIQGYAARWIKHITGSHSGIMGLPLYETSQLLREFK